MTESNNLSQENIADILQAESYIADDAIAMSIFLAMKIGKPLLVEGPAGVGKTEIAKAMARALDLELIRRLAIIKVWVDMNGLNTTLWRGGRCIAGSRRR